MRQVALAVTRNGVSLLKQLDRGYLERAVDEAGWELARRTQVLGAPKMIDLDRTTYNDIELWGWRCLNEAREPRAEIAILGAATEVTGRYSNDLSTSYKVPADLPWFWASPHYIKSKRGRLTLAWEPSFPEEPHDHGWLDQSYGALDIYHYVELWLRGVSSRLRLRVFISYAREDVQMARQLRDHLTRSGHEPWLDEQNLLPGHDWQLEIRRAVQTADAIVTLISRRSASKVGYVQKEIRLAIDAAERRPEGSIFVVPVLLDNAQVPDSLSQWNTLDSTRADWLDRLLLSLDHIRRIQ